jgi:aspartyl-tRNA(Asn)/glutamyl-tRNA(Gln) amidotransferase subunit B
VEIKNLNSFRFLKQALDYEILRQVGVLESGGRIVQETRLYDPDVDETFPMRGKEEAHDYRYFPEPDLAPLEVSDEWLKRVKAAMPEMPASRRQRFTSEFGLREYDAQVLTQSRAVSDYFEKTAAACGDAKLAAAWVSGELAKEVLPKMFATGDAARAIVEREGLKAISDTGQLERIVDEVIAANPKQVEQYRGGKTTLVQFFIGQVMKATRGQADPATAAAVVKAKLG